MDYEMIEKMNMEELKNYLKIRDLKVTGKKKEVVARVINAQEINVIPVKIAVEVQAVFKNE